MRTCINQALGSIYEENRFAIIKARSGLEVRTGRLFSARPDPARRVKGLCPARSARWAR